MAYHTHQERRDGEREDAGNGQGLVGGHLPEGVLSAGREESEEIGD